MVDFAKAYEALTGNAPFPWQRALYERFAIGDIPASCNLPTGLGKTSVIAVWLIALANHPDKMPRRLVYVVNRRTVVDQTTEEVEKYQFPLAHRRAPIHPVLLDLADALARLSSDPDKVPLAVSTLRGQFADNREWSADPSRPAVICGTVDMIGSRLLFNGYGVGMKGRPLHAGFLGQDALLVHDEAHLEPAFQTLIEAIRDEQTHCKDFRPLRVMELTATSRGKEKPFGLTDEDKKNDTVRERVTAKKAVHLEPVKDAKKLAEQLVSEALKFADKNRAVLVFARTVDDVMKIRDKLPKGRVETLTGTMRGKERDGLVEKELFKRFMPGGQSDVETSYLVCTSAGEVGVNISADHLVCDLSTFDSMAQRFGRVNRFGKRDDSEIRVVHPTKFEDDDYDQRRDRTLNLLNDLNGDGSPDALGKLDPVARQAAFAPPPTILPATDILFDAWALTTIKGKLPGRPDVDAFLHGVADESYDTEFAWRKEVTLLKGEGFEEAIAELLDEFPLKPHETLRVPTFGKKNGAYAHLEAIRERNPNLPAWVIESNGEVTVYSTLAELLKKEGKDDYAVRLAERTVVLPPEAGGLTANGTLDGGQAYDPNREDYDVAGTPPDKVPPLLRLQVTSTESGQAVARFGPSTSELWEGAITITPGEKWLTRVNRWLREDRKKPVRPIYTLDIPDPENEDAQPKQYVVVKPIQPRTGDAPDAEWPDLDTHLKGVAEFAEQITSRLNLDPKLAEAVVLAAKWHDHGKARAVWQRGAGNNAKHTPVAKTLHGRAPENLNHYRHELGSMVDVSARADLAAAFDALDDDHKSVVLHLIATHHGRGRPHFPADESYDIDRPTDVVNGVAADTPGRFARLQRQFGRWGLAYLESLLRAADVLESQRIEAAPLPEPSEWPAAKPAEMPDLRPLPPRTPPTPSITVAVDPTNPGQFFACCGLLELADRLWPTAEGWFSESGREFKIAFTGEKETLRRLLAILIMDPPTAVERLENGLEVPPIIAPLAFSFDGGSTTGIVLDGWTRIAVLKSVVQVIGNSPWNFWSGNQTSMKIWLNLRAELAAQLRRMSDPQLRSLFEQRVFQQGRFGFDPGPAWNALDVGFSLNEHNVEVESSPATEMLAAVGLQRFRPVMNEDRDGFDYFTWHSACSPLVAAAAMAGATRDSRTLRFRASVTSRGQYAALGFAFPLSAGDTDE